MIRKVLVAVAAASAVLGLGASAQAYAPPRVVGQVYQPTNDPSGNAIAVFDRLADGSLRPQGTVLTGGLGSGVALNSQGGIVRDGSLLFVVNAGDDTISSLTVKHGSLRLRDRIGSGGDGPVSITVHDGVGYVLNHDSDTISGFRYDRSGDLRQLRLSTRSLTPNAAGGVTDAAQVQFSPGGHTLVVTEKATNTIDTFRVRFGYAGSAHPHASAGSVPYGFDFDRHGSLVVSEAAGSTSSYRLWPWFATVTGALGNTQAAACWLVVTGHYAWVVNAASASVSSYRIHGNGSLTLVHAVAGSTGAGPTDAAASPDGRNLYVRLADGSVESFRIGHDGGLTPTGTAFVTTNYGIAGLVAD